MDDSEKRFENDTEGNYRGLILKYYLGIFLARLMKTTKISVRIIAVQADI
jgi:hypothetical protein